MGKNIVLFFLTHRVVPYVKNKEYCFLQLFYNNQMSVVVESRDIDLYRY